ncbi:hypothetical protein L6452_36753 [Arctium lappa]|uniref:Uncharacterized protein n=1 Tax=Arctium lappa TaxID=4217 RepID=A0ACB8Y595_ARCLA|nr:hypothetical protein L6452_36753 [Arctium lappa]
MGPFTIIRLYKYYCRMNMNQHKCLLEFNSSSFSCLLYLFSWKSFLAAFILHACFFMDLLVAGKFCIWTKVNF